MKTAQVKEILNVSTILSQKVKIILVILGCAVVITIIIAPILVITLRSYHVRMNTTTMSVTNITTMSVTNTTTISIPTTNTKIGTHKKVTH